MADLKPLLILGGVGLGVFVLASLLSPPESNVKVNPPPLPPGRGNAAPQPDVVAAAIAAAQAAALAGIGPEQPTAPGPVPTVYSPAAGVPLPNPAPLVQGQRYKARLELTGLEGLAGRDTIKSMLEGAGFSNVVVYMTQSELPPGWPPAALTNIGNGSRWTEGTWSKASQLVAKAPQIQNAFLA